MELEALSGAVVKYGRALGIPTPIHKTIYGALLPYHLEHLGTKP
jgi:ketopantoate reductase